MAGSARRHLKAALKLYAEEQPGEQPGCRAVSGYLFGLAGELALKHMMSCSGMKPNPNDKRNDPFYAHFPSLRTMVADVAHGRLQGALKRISDSGVFENWSTEMRYAPTTQIQAAWVDKWKAQATDLVNKLGDL
ncbi:hypothetical protein P6U16_02260 [Rhizobium sp. 32-5/1]|uniref:hypothetical protein n=1 Tax=Rhizobium sp. 32-5/1 TaxID=3019602 RepID=UPI00240D98B9|nr:hypothetical protein [Rhizobium sp. 32-5/1]WEZ83663.1 hypothetical protein P6U16_02260 [Rhizobium sp. 32-5/1]